MPDTPSRRPRVIFVNRFYWPDEPATAQLLTDLAEQLAGRGQEVIVISRHPGTAMPRDEIHQGVRILRVRSTRRTKAGLVGKAVDFATFYLGAMWRLLRQARPCDAIVAMTDPPLLGIGIWLVARWRGARLFHWVQDIYPELAIELAGARWLRITRPLRNAAWRGATQCVTLGSDMAATLTGGGVLPGNISIVPNWPPAGLSPQPASNADELRTRWGLTGKFVIAYSGNLGRVHDLSPVLDLANALRDERDIVFLFIGGGPQRAALATEASQRGLANVLFHAAQPRALLARSLALGDLHLVTMRAGCEHLVFPSKLYGIAAVGRPVIFVGPPGCEIARLVVDRGFGFAFAREEISGLAAKIRALRDDPAQCGQLGRAAADFAAAGDGLRVAAERWAQLLRPAPGLAVPPPRA